MVNQKKANHHFVSYSSADAQDFALYLYDELAAASFPMWLDERELMPGEDWDEQIVEGIRTCASLLFVMTPDSVEPQSVCKQEWTRALKYKKPVVPLLLHPDAETPFRLGSRQYIDFTDDFETALAKLRKHLKWLASPAGTLQGLKHRLADADRDLRRAKGPDNKRRIEAEIAQLKQDITRQQRIVDDPEGARVQVQKNIEQGLERDRTPEKPVTGVSRTKFINPPPGLAPTYFQDRYVETKMVGDFLKDEAQRLMIVVGRGGSGKTIMVCRLLKALEGGHLPDDLGPLKVDGIVYLSKAGSYRSHVNVTNLYTGLGRLLPDDEAERLEQLYKDPRLSIEEQIYALLEAFPEGRVAVLLDNLEDVVDAQTRNVTDAELDEALRALLNAGHHAVKVIITTRVAPRDLLLVQPGRQRRLDLDEGLPSPYAENILREMDADGTVGLKKADDALLNEARKRTGGNPRALEALFAILSADRETNLEEILADTEKLLPENVVEVLVGEAFSRLDASAQKVMQALAVYRIPVSPAAVDYLLQPYLPGVNSGPVLGRLVNMKFARREGGRYYLHEVDRAYASSLVPRGEETDRAEAEAPPFTEYALLARGADYFVQARTARASWKTLDDLSAQLAEFDLRCAGEDYDTAASVLLEIDFDYLLLWGQYRLMVELHERLRGKLSDPYLESKSVGSLGTAYHSMSQNRRAIACYEQALEIFREIGDRWNEGIALVGLGNCYSNLGQTQQAIDHYEQALEIAREIGDRGGEGVALGNLGNRYADLGQTQQAIDHHEQALEIARDIGNRRNEGSLINWLGNSYADLGQTQKAVDHYEQALVIARDIGDRGSEGIALGNLGNSYADLGQTQKAIDHYEQALVIAREIERRGDEGTWLGNLGGRYADLGQIQKAIDHYDQALVIARNIGDRDGASYWLACKGEVLLCQDETDKAIKLYVEAIEIADQTGNAQNQLFAQSGLATAQLYTGDLPTARATAEAAREYDYPLGKHVVLALLGMIALRQGDRPEASSAFVEAADEAGKLLHESEHNFAAWDTKGLALCGLALCEGSSEHLPNAINAYKAARAINRDAGIVGRVLRLFDELAQADEAGLLAEVRDAAAGGSDTNG